MQNGRGRYGRAVWATTRGRGAAFGLLGLAVLVALGLAMWGPVPAARADTTLTDCSEGALTTAVAAGGVVTYGMDCTVTLTGTLTLTTNVTIDGGGHSVTIQGNDTFTLLSTNSGVTLNLIGLSFTKGHGTIMTLYSLSGGAIFARGPVNVTGCTFTANAASEGGAIESEVGPLTITDTTFSTNSSINAGGGEFAGGAIHNRNGSITVIGSTFTNNHADVYGANSGAISVASGQLTVIGSTFNGNTSSFSGGAISTSNSSTAIIDSTFTGNSLIGDGAALIANGATTIVNSTITGNSANAGGAVYANGSFAAVTVTNSIISGNTGFVGDCTTLNGGTITDGGYNLESGGTSCGFTNHAQSGNPMLGMLGNNGGPTQTIVPQMGSPALGNGDLTVCQNTNIGTGGSGPYDQRGALRIFNNACSIGAVEPGNTTLQDTTTLSVSANGTPVMNGGNVPFGASLTLTATVIGARGEPLPGSETYTFKDGTMTIGTASRSGTHASTTVPANLAPGMHTLSVNAFPGNSTYAASPTPNTLTVNITPITCQVTSTLDPTESGKLTLRDAVNAANAGACTMNTITFAAATNGTPITLTSVLPTLVTGVTIIGNGASQTTITPNSARAFNLITVTSGDSTFTGLSLTNGYDGVRNTSTSAVTVLNSIISGSAEGIRNMSTGTIHTTGDTFSGNGDDGIRNQSTGSVTVTGSSFTSNGGNGIGNHGTGSGGSIVIAGSTFTSNGYAGIDSDPAGAVTVTDSVFTSNAHGIYASGTSAFSVSGSTFTSNPIGIAAFSSTTLSVANSTFSGSTTQAINGSSTGAITVTSSTLANNARGVSVGGGNPPTLTDTLLSGNTTANCSGTVTDGGHNLENPGNSCGFSSATQTGAPLLSALADWGGGSTLPDGTHPPTFALLPGSAAIGTGACNPTYTDAVSHTSVTVTTDARGVMRPGADGTCDIGAFESQGFSFSMKSGDNQSTGVGTAFPTALGLTVTSSHNEPVVGGVVTFTGPMMGAGITGSPITATISGTAGASTGTVSQSASANSTAGAYTVTVSATGVPAMPATTYSLANTQAPTITSASQTTFTAGMMGSFTVTATGYPAPTFSETGMLPTGVTLDGMTGALSGTATVANTYHVTITATNGISPDATQMFTLTVTPAAATHFLVTGVPSPIALSTPANVTVTAQDAFGNTATGYTGTVRFSSTDPAATLPANYPFVGGDLGVHTFPNGVTFNTAGTQTLTATDTITAGITGSETGIMVRQGMAGVNVASSSPMATSTVGTSVTFTATVTGASGIAPTGTITFRNGMTALGAAVPLVVGTGGVSTATLSTSSLPVGMDTITASYGGDTNYPMMSGTLTQTVHPVTPSVQVTVAPLSVAQGTSVALAASVGTGMNVAPPTGNVTFTSGSTMLGSAALDAMGVARVNASTTNLPVGMDTITATYAGDTNYITGSGTTSVTITAAQVTSLSATAPTGAGSGNNGSATMPSIPAGETVTLTVRGSYTNGTMGMVSGLTFMSSNPNVAVVDGSGKVTGIAAGTVTITVMGPNGTSTTISVTVTAPTGGGLQPPAPQSMMHPIVATPAAATPAPQPSRAPNGGGSGVQPQAATTMPASTPTPNAQPGRH